jgi:hypothetical protein
LVHYLYEPTGQPIKLGTHALNRPNPEHAPARADCLRVTRADRPVRLRHFVVHSIIFDKASAIFYGSELSHSSTVNLVIFATVHLVFFALVYSSILATLFSHFKIFL